MVVCGKTKLFEISVHLTIKTRKQKKMNEFWPRIKKYY